MYSTHPGEEISFPATIQPIAGAPGTFLSEPISLDSGTGRRLFAVVKTGVIGVSGTVDVSFVGAPTLGGTYNIPIPGSAIVQDTTGGNLHTITAAIDLIKSVAPTATYVKLKIVTGTAATPIDATVMGFECANNPPASASAASARVTSQNITALA